MPEEGARPKNPFNPTAPIDPSYFAGRADEVGIIVRALSQTRHGAQQNVLITGERGIGKSSLAHFARYIAQEPRDRIKTDCRFAAAYYTLDDKDAISDFCYGSIEKLNRIVRPTLTDRFFEKLRQWDCSIKLSFWFGSTEVGPARGQHREADPSKVRRDFVKILEAVWDDVCTQGFNGILLILDEMNKVHQRENLGAFFKRVSEDLISDGYRNIMLLLVGLPWLETKIASDDPSAVRIFEHVSLGPMPNAECEAVIERALEGAGVTIAPEAKEGLVDYSGGFPYFLQQMSFDSFEANSDSVIDIDDVHLGITNSLTQFDRMFFGRVLREMEGKNYQKIIETLAEDLTPDGMRVIDLGKKSKVKGVGQYLPRLVREGVITSPKKGRYKLASKAFSLYVYVERRVGRWRKNGPPSGPSQGASSGS